MSVPLLVAVDDDLDQLRDAERELRNRYEPDYRVCCLRSTSEALATLDELAAAGEQVRVREARGVRRRRGFDRDPVRPPPARGVTRLCTERRRSRRR
jgi:hypothetical protein